MSDIFKRHEKINLRTALLRKSPIVRHTHSSPHLPFLLLQPSGKTTSTANAYQFSLEAHLYTRYCQNLFQMNTVTDDSVQSQQILWFSFLFHPRGQKENSAGDKQKKIRQHPWQSKELYWFWSWSLHPQNSSLMGHLMTVIGASYQTSLVKGPNVASVQNMLLPP